MATVPVRTAQLSRSGIREMMDLAWATPGPVIRLELGQPDAVPPPHVLQAVRTALDRGATGYTPNAGVPALREACAEKLARVNGIRRAPGQVVVTAGSMQGLFAAILGLTEPGDEVLLADPGWPNHAMMCHLAGVRAVPFPLRAEDDHRPDFDRIAALVDGRTRMIVVNSPSNPLGVTWTGDEMTQLLALAERHDLWVLSDECYDQIAFAQPPVSPAALPGGEDRVVTAHSFSKTYAMTGLRVGYVSAPPRVATALATMQEPLVACANGPAQEGALAALTGPQEFVASRCATYLRRRDRAVAAAREVGLRHTLPEGAFYLWVEVGDVGDTTALCRRLVTGAGVAVAPGATFSRFEPQAVRVSLANAGAAIDEGLRRLAAFLAHEHRGR